MSKIIFLDIDGVLNSVEYSVASRTNERRTRIDDADPTKVGLLRFVCEQTGANLVISSTWRIGRQPEWFKGFFAAFGWPDAPIGGMATTRAKTSVVGRGDEVAEWLHDYGSLVDNYVIVDDDSDFYPEQPLVQTNSVYGLTLKETIAMIDMLGLDENGDAAAVRSLRTHVDFKP
jgi:hypothetical protein